jgi:hypothetical protein
MTTSAVAPESPRWRLCLVPLAATSSPYPSRSDHTPCRPQPRSVSPGVRSGYPAQDRRRVEKNRDESGDLVRQARCAGRRGAGSGDQEPTAAIVRITTTAICGSGLHLTLADAAGDLGEAAWAARVGVEWRRRPPSPWRIPRSRSARASRELVPGRQPSRSRARAVSVRGTPSARSIQPGSPGCRCQAQIRGGADRGSRQRDRTGSQKLTQLLRPDHRLGGEVERRHA